MADAIPNLLVAEVTEIKLTKHKSSESMSLLPQFLEFNVYQSIFNPIMKAEVLINDPLGLHVNWPLLGEEMVEVTIKPTRQDLTDPNVGDIGGEDRLQQTLTLKFWLSDVRAQIPDDKARASVYVLTLYSEEMYHNAKWRVQKAYKDQYSNIIPDILKSYLETKLGSGAISTAKSNSNKGKINNENFEESRGSIQVIIPNMKPLAAIKWCTQRAVPKDTDHNLYFFYENFEGFHLRTVQNIVKKWKPNSLKHRQFMYFSDITPQLRDYMKSLGITNLDQYAITAISQNKRYSTVEKIIGGYYENEFYSIDIYNKKVVSKKTELTTEIKNSVVEGTTLFGNVNKGSVPNTKQFVDDAKTRNDKDGVKTRVRYHVTQNGGDDPDDSNKDYFEDKFGDAVRLQAALAQISITVAVPGNTMVQAGEIVELLIPEMHGFNIVKHDYYVAGRYIVTDIKHTISAGMKHIMVMTLNRDAFSNEVETKTRLNLNPMSAQK